MNNIITVSDNAVKQIKKIISDANFEVDGLIVDIDKSGCNGYSYKLEYAKNGDYSKYEIIEKDGRYSFKSSRISKMLESIDINLLSIRETSRYFVGLLVFLGLLGTFWGLLKTIGSVGNVISGLG